MSRPRLTVSIITKNSEKHLDTVVKAARVFADEVLIGVDSSSEDQTFDLASTIADTVYQFRHNGRMAQARTLFFQYATGDWILSLDDDEMIDDGFGPIVPELLSNRFVTHYLFPRKHIVNLDPPEYFHASPWFPDWQTRLFVNERSLIWKPERVHTGYRVLGPNYFETRASILHFEPVWCDLEERRRKIESYRTAGSNIESERIYAIPADPAFRRPAQLPRLAVSHNKTSPTTVHSEVHELRPRDLPPLRSALLAADLPQTVRAGAPILAQVLVKNLGDLAWMPPNIQDLPMLKLGCHLLDAKGIVQWDFIRSPVARFVPPGGEVSFIFEFNAPEKDGDYWLEWDMVSEFEFWFGEGGSEVLRSRLNVQPK